MLDIVIHSHLVIHIIIHTSFLGSHYNYFKWEYDTRKKNPLMKYYSPPFVTIYFIKRESVI